MRLASILAVACTAAALCVSLPAVAATAQQGTMKSCASTWSGMAAADKAKTKYKDYMSTCMKAPAPAAMAAPAPAMAMKPAPAMAMKPAPAMGMKPTSGMKMAAPASSGSAKCKDGTVVTYKNRSGTCSGHKGVATWM